jgi:hypothetical protein
MRPLIDRRQAGRASGGPAMKRCNKPEILLFFARALRNRFVEIETHPVSTGSCFG